MCGQAELAGWFSVVGYLLEVSKHVHPAVEDALPLGRIQLVDKLGGVKLVALLVPGV